MDKPFVKNCICAVPATDALLEFIELQKKIKEREDRLKLEKEEEERWEAEKKRREEVSSSKSQISGCKEQIKTEAEAILQ